MKIAIGSAGDVTADNVSNNGSTPSTPLQGPSSLAGCDYADEPIHIINVSIQCNNLETLNDAELTRKCHQYVQVRCLQDLWVTCVV